MVLSESAGRLTPGRTWADQVAARRPHGVILVLSGLDESQRALLTSRSIPFVVMDPAGDPGDDVPSVGATNWQGGLAATRHLVELGHRRIGVDQRALPDDVQPRPGRRLPRGAGDGRAAGRPRADHGRRLPPRGRLPASASNCCAAPTGPPPSSPATTSRRSASTRPPASWGCASRRT